MTVQEPTYTTNDNDEYNVVSRVTSEEQPRFNTQIDLPIPGKLDEIQKLPQINNQKNIVVPEQKRRNFDLSRQFQPPPVELDIDF